MDTIAMDIQGMSCGHCVSNVRQALAEVDGASVSRVAVGSAEVGYDPAKTNAQAILAAVESAGYRARVVARTA